MTAINSDAIDYPMLFLSDPYTHIARTYWRQHASNTKCMHGSYMSGTGRVLSGNGGV